MDQRAGAELGEQFEQDRVRHLAVEDHHAFDAALERVDAGFDFGNHAAGNGAVGNTPPVLKFEPSGKSFQGPLATLASAVTMEATLGAPLPLHVMISDDMKYTSGTNAPPTGSRSPVSMRWTKYRGPGAVTFDKARPEIEKVAGSAPFHGKADATAKFSEPGDYVLHATGNDYSGDGGGGVGCCWTTSLVKVSVK